MYIYAVAFTKNKLILKKLKKTNIFGLLKKNEVSIVSIIWLNLFVYSTNLGSKYHSDNSSWRDRLVCQQRHTYAIQCNILTVRFSNFGGELLVGCWLKLGSQNGKSCFFFNFKLSYFSS